MTAPIRIFVTGLRGFPGIQGGIETHAQFLYPKLLDLGCEIEVAVRPRFYPGGVPPTHGPIRFIPLYAPRKSGLEALVHTAIAICYACVKRPDIVHIHAVGPALMTPLARLFGLRVVFTHHGPDYDREKWGKFARTVLKLGERMGARWSNRCIAISQTIHDRLLADHGVSAEVIPNGVPHPVRRQTTVALDRLGLVKGRFVLQVSRLVPEKRQRDLLRAFEEAELDGWKLVLVGRPEPTAYCKEVEAMAAKNPAVVMAGFQTGQDLEELYSGAGLFVLPSSHEGLPIALLEAMSFGVPVVASDIPANLEVDLDKTAYFPLGEIEALAAVIRSAPQRYDDTATRERNRMHVRTHHDWAEIALATRRVYDEVMGYSSARVADGK